MPGCCHAGEEGGGDAHADLVHAAELVIDGGTLSHVLGTEAEKALARVGAQVLIPWQRILEGFLAPSDREHAW